MCRIVRGEQPARILFEDECLLAFLHIAPVNPGHALVIPRQHYNSLTSVPPEVLKAAALLLPRLAQGLLRAVKGDGFNLHLANGENTGQAFPHTHWHIIPRYGNDGFAWNSRVVDCTTAEQDAIVRKVRKRLEPVDEA